MNAVLKQPFRATAPSVAELRSAWLRSSAEYSADALDDLLADCPHYVPAHLLRLGKLVAAKTLRTFPALARALEAVQPHLRRAGELERMHVAAAAAWAGHRPLLAAHLYSTLSANDPFDLLALRLAQSSWFFLARRKKIHAVAERASRAWSPTDDAYDVALALQAFGCSEVGDAARAEALATRALSLEPRNPFAIHALAHALGERGEPAAVVEMLDTRARYWRAGGRIYSHTAWHGAVAELALGNVAQAAATLELELAPRAGLGASAAGDATDLAWRLDLLGWDMRATWARIAEGWSRHHAVGFWAPDDVLAGIAYIRARRSDELHALRHRLATGPHLRRCAQAAAQVLTLPALAAIEAFARDDYAVAEDSLAATIRLMGGSLLQRELFELTLHAASRRRAPFSTRPAALRIPA